MYIESMTIMISLDKRARSTWKQKSLKRMIGKGYWMN